MTFLATLLFFGPPSSRPARRPGSSLTVRGVGMNPFATGSSTCFRRMGADIRPVGSGSRGGSRWRTWSFRGGELVAGARGSRRGPGLIDEVPILCVAAPSRRAGRRSAARESCASRSRTGIASMVDCLSTLGIPCGEYPDGLWVEGRPRLRPPVRATAGETTGSRCRCGFSARREVQVM